MRKATRAFAAVAAASALALAGCSAGGDAQSSSAAMPELSDINVQPRDALTKGGTLRMAIGSMPTTYNVMNVNGTQVDLASTISSFVSVNNWIFDPEGEFTANPNWIESFDTKVEDDKQLVTLKLNKDAVWGDGTPITVDDYVASWKACNGEDDAFLCATTDGYSAIESIEKGADEFEVVVTFKTVYPDWSAPLSNVYPASGVSDAATFNDGWTKPKPEWFSGPYAFGDINESQQVITLVPNPKWWGEEPMLDKVTFRVLDPSATSNAFANSEIDILDGIIDGEQYQQASTRTDAEIRRAGGLQWRHFTFNAEAGVLQDKEVRQAINRGIDTAAITAADMAGIPDIDPASLALGNHFFMPGQTGYQDNGTDYAYDPERAGKELDDLGWTLPEGQEYRSKDGETLEFDYAMLPDISTSKTEGELLQSQMKAIGVKVNIKNADTATFFPDTVLGGKFGVTSFAWQGTPYPLHNIGQLYSCNLAPEGQNYARLCVKEIDELDKKVQSEDDTTKRNELGNEVDKLIWENVMVVPLYRRLSMVATPKNLANYGAYGMQTVPAENIGFVGDSPADNS